MKKHKIENYTEIIVKEIVNKIISLTISNSLKIRTDNEVTNNCFEFTKKSINNMLSTFFILYDKDEPRLENKINNEKNNKSFFKIDLEDSNNNNYNIINNNSSNNSNNSHFYKKNGDESELIFKNYFFNNTYKGNNDWDIIDELCPPKLDRYSSTLISSKNLNNNMDNKYKINQEGILEVDENENDEKSYFNQTKKDKIQYEKDFYKNIKIEHKKQNDDKEYISKKKLNELANQFEYYDIEPEKINAINETDEIKKLREKYIELEKQKNNEKKINKNKQIMKLQINEEDNIKKYEGKKINKDHNGKIIFIKAIKLSKLKKDFLFGKIKFKTINKEKIMNEKGNKKNSKIYTKDNNIDNSIKKNLKKVNIKSLPKLSNSKKKLSNITIETKNKKQEIKSIPIKKRTPMIICGSNFDLMSMETGVTLKEDKKYKTGGLDFQSKFKKFSLEEYNKKLKEAEEANNLKTNIQFTQEPKNETLEDINTLFKTNYNSIQTEPNYFKSRNINNNMYSTNTNNFSMFNHYLKNLNSSKFGEKTFKDNSNTNPFIQLTMGSSLIASFDKLNLVSFEEEKNHKKRDNIFRNGRKNIFRKENKVSFDNMNEFNKNLMTNKKFELKEDERIKTLQGVKSPGKPDIKELIQEIGVKGKILRNRFKAMTPFKSAYIENEKFFKN